MDSNVILRSLNEMDRENTWIKDNYEDLKEKYDNKFIAVKDGKILAVNSDINKVIREIKGGSPAKVLIQFVSKIPTIF